MQIRLGSHPNNLSLFILRHRGVLESAAQQQGWQIAWLDYQQGGDSGRLLREDQLDIVGTGSTPPVTSAASGLDVAYLASSTPRDANCALLSAAGNDLTSLRGKRLAAMPGSFTDHFLARLLQQQGLRRDDIDLQDLRGQAALDALLNGEIDGWLAIDPWLTRAAATAGVQRIAEVGELIVNRSLFWTRRGWTAAHPQAAAWLVAQLQHNDRWIAQHQPDVADLLHLHLNNTITREEWQSTLAARPWGIIPADAALLDEQQQQADDLYAAGFIDTSFSLTPRSNA
ncbi:ABC transporter substrate-binding protein [Erwiniaceae bacterium BAC15a-03b]|uniref:ABC transporter substrate-binding protein n=1 Tax=Winslowiella arboricola TaxID=2978220 RepID=A0A9J6PRA5_9GAMM|nr:ABC transporter substrate-binding protein [Winslowiella arboricola]MCU5771661.1 ABC transporter substrate-binding protein [Winslowiella arboricola]MCU5778136.1 ABC transporter substrate-binding protein [Winslowiella arboricola]